MDAKIFLWQSRVPARASASPFKVEHWFLLAESVDGKLITALPIATIATVRRLMREGVPVKQS